MSDEVKKDGTLLSEEGLNKLLKLINEVEFGSVTVIIQNGIVIQIEKNEKIRLV